MIQIQTNIFNTNQTIIANYNPYYENNSLSIRKKRLNDYEADIAFNQFINSIKSYQFINIVELDLSSNLLTKFPSQLIGLANLCHLNLFSNKLTTFPREIVHFPNLISLNLSRNSISEPFPDVLCESLIKLKDLKLSGNSIPSLPNQFHKLSSLESLILGNSTGGNSLESFPSGVLPKLKNLKILDLSNNFLKSLPYDLGFKGSKVEFLCLYNNSLFTLPKSIGLLQNLKSLDVSKNKISYLPVDLVDLENLNTLDLSSNCLCVIPADIARFMKKTSLVLTGNPMTKDNVSHLGSIGDFSESSQYTPSYHSFSGMTSPTSGYNHVSPNQLVERLKELKIESENGFMSSSGENIYQDSKPMVPSLKEMAMRVILSEGLHLSSKSIPRTVLRLLENGARPCGFCASPYVAEFVEGVEHIGFQGHPSLPTKVAYCSNRCKSSSLPSTPNPNAKKDSFDQVFSRELQRTMTSYSENSIRRFSKGVPPKSWKPYRSSSKLRPTITSKSSPLVPVRDLTLVDSLNDW